MFRYRIQEYVQAKREEWLCFNYSLSKAIKQINKVKMRKDFYVSQISSK